jgi:hypothetical protein
LQNLSWKWWWWFIIINDDTNNGWMQKGVCRGETGERKHTEEWSELKYVAYIYMDTCIYTCPTIHICICVCIHIHTSSLLLLFKQCLVSTVSNSIIKLFERQEGRGTGV